MFTNAKLSPAKRKRSRPWGGGKCLPEVKVQMKALYKTGSYTQREIGLMFDVTQAVVQRIVSER
jgi:hypothetical protein